MSNLNDLIRQLNVLLIKYKDAVGNFRTAVQILKDIGETYEKFYNSGVSAYQMKLLDQVYFDVMINWDQMVRKYNENFESCSDGTQTLEDKGAIGEYKEMVGGTDQVFIQLM